MEECTYLYIECYKKSEKKKVLVISFTFFLLCRIVQIKGFRGEIKKVKLQVYHSLVNSSLLVLFKLALSFSAGKENSISVWALIRLQFF